MLRSRTAGAMLSAVLVLAACASGAPVPNGASPTSPGTDTASVSTQDPTKPNIVFVLTDDLSMNLAPYMPAVQQMRAEGTTFENFFVTNSLCCPSRTTILTGRYPHNTGIRTNTEATGGGYQVFKRKGLDEDTFATDLQAAGYRTAMMGKYLNEYQPGSPKKPTASNPVGYDEWALAASGYAGFSYNLNVNGEVTHHGRAESDYLTDVLSGLGQDFVKRSVADGEPFMLELSSFTPHKPYVPAPRHAETYPGLKAPRGDSYGVRNTNAPTWLANQKLTPSRIATMDEQFRMRVQSVQAINDLIVAIRGQLAATGVAGNTYVVFSSDNGYHMGEHSLISGKMTAFDTDIHVPLVVVGPDVPAGGTVGEMASTIDLRPTFGDLAGAVTPTTVDGNSLVPLWNGGTDDQGYVLVEHTGMEVDTMDPDAGIFRSPIPPNYGALRTKDWLYVEYENGQREYYDRTNDPLELHNIVRTLPEKRLRKLSDRLRRAVACSGQAECSVAVRR